MSEYAIEAHNLTKVFRSWFRKREFRAVDGITLNVPRGTTFGLLGPNGAGKTTFIKMLLSAVHPTSGSATIFGRDSRIPEARRPIGYLPENHRFPTYFTGAGMLDFYGALSGMDGSLRRRRIPELLELVGLKDWANVRLGKYSKGMLQRVGLAQALVHSPEILILDEPSDGVDPVGRRRIRDILGELEQRGTTIFINSHLLVEVELFCREVAIMNRGRIVLVDSVKRLIAGKGYRVSTPAPLPDRLRDQLRAMAGSGGARDGVVEFYFTTREQTNRAVDLLRSERVEVESIVPTASTLEEVFMRALEGK